MTQRDWLYLCIITLLAGALRFYQLDAVPPGPQFDEAFNAIDAEQVLAGNRPLFMPANGGREVLYTYYQAALGVIFGRLDLFTLRLASALAGTLTVPALYVTVRSLFQRNSQSLALLTSLALAVNYWHIHFSHYGIRIILMPLIFCGVFGLFWLGMQERRTGMRWIAFIASGALTGLSVWNNPTGRFAPLVLAAYVIWLLWRYPQRRKRDANNPLAGLLITGAVAFLVFLPLGLEFIRHPEFFFGHASEVSVFAERVSGNLSPWLLLGNNILRVFGMFSFDGDPDWTHGIPDRPVFDWFMAIPFYIGVVVWMMRLLGKEKNQPDPDRDVFFLFLAWAIVMLAPSVLSEAAPNYSRTLAAVPPVMLGAGLGLTWIATQPRWPRSWRYSAVAFLVTASGVSATYDYFVRFPSYTHVYHAFDADKVDAVQWMKERGEDGYSVFLSPLWSTHATVTFLRNHHIRSLDTTQAMVLPAPGKGAIYAFPAEQQDYAEDVANVWNEPVETLDDRYDRPLMYYIKVDATKVQSWPDTLAPDDTTSARFDDAPTLIGMRAGEGDQSLLLHWQTDAATYRNLTSFVHLLNANGQRIGQADVIPGDSTFSTPSWRSGERVVQRYAPEITDACSGGETVRVVTGWYEYAAGGALRPRLDAPGGSALAGTWTLPFTSMTNEQIQPAVLSSIPLAPDGLTLIGHTLSVATSEPGAPMALDLYLQGAERHSYAPVTLTLQSDPATVLYTGGIAPGATWREGEVLCRRLRVRFPTSISPGEYPLSLSTTGNEQFFAQIIVQPSSRSFDLPVVAESINATLGNAIRLHGVDIELDKDTLEVRLVWQSLVPLTTSEKVFVHLIAPDGGLIAQSDALPANGYGTNQWVEGEVVVDEHSLELPDAQTPGSYRLRIGMYDPASGERVPAIDGSGSPLADDAVELAIGQLR